MQGPNNNSVQRVEILKNTRSESTTYVGGNSLVYDPSGQWHKVEDLFNDVSKFSSEPLNIFYLNETTLRMEQTRIKTIIKQSEKKSMLRFSTMNGSFDFSHEREVMVNRDGALSWVAANKIEKGDLLVAPKYFRRDIRDIAWKDAITTPYHLIKGDKTSPSRLISQSGLDRHEVGMPDGFHLCKVYYLVGMLDACGWLDQKNSALHLRTPDKYAAGVFCGIMSSLFLVEPEMTGDKKSGYCVDVTNSIVVDILAYTLSHLFCQEDDYIGFYLSGLIDGAGKVVDGGKYQSVIFFSSNEVQRQRIKKALHVFGILAFRQTQTYLSIDYFDDIEQIAVVTDLRLEQNQETISKIMIKETGKDNPYVGYCLGSMLHRDRQMFRVAKSGFGLPASAITRYEKGALVPHTKAWHIAETINDNISPTDSLPSPGLNVPFLVASDIIGIKVINIEDIGEQTVFDIECEGSKNFFVNDILCRR